MRLLVICLLTHTKTWAASRSFKGTLRPTGIHRSEEHTSELQSLRHLVCRLLLEKKYIRHVGHILFCGGRVGPGVRGGRRGRGRGRLFRVKVGMMRLRVRLYSLNRFFF